MEEVMQTLVDEHVVNGERGNYHHARALTDVRIPPTVYGVIAARIDRLAPEEKLLLQQLAVTGRPCPLELVRHVIAHQQTIFPDSSPCCSGKNFSIRNQRFPTESICSSMPRPKKWPTTPCSSIAAKSSANTQRRRMRTCFAIS
jgi:hypothetical protein